MNNMEYAGFWLRLAAVMIDVILMMIVLYIPLLFIYGQDYLTAEQAIHGFWDVMLTYVLPFIATIWFWLRFMGTPGKMAVRLKVVDASTGDKMSTGQAIGRYFSYILAVLPLGLGLLWIGFDKRKQGWHDKLAGTVVIRDGEAETFKFEDKA